MSEEVGASAEVVQVDSVGQRRGVENLLSQLEDELQRKEVLRIAIAALIFGAVVGAISFVPAFSGWNSVAEPTFVIFVTGAMSITGFSGTSLMFFFVSVVVIGLNLLMAWWILTVADAIPNDDASSAFQYIMVVLYVSVASFFFTDIPRSFAFGLSPIYFFLFSPNINLYVGWSFVWMLIGGGIAFTLTLCVGDCRFANQTSSERVRVATAKSARLIERAAYLVCVKLPQLCLSAHDDEKRGGQPHFFKTQMAVMADLYTASGLLSAGERYLALATGQQMGATAFEFWGDPRQQTIIIAAVDHLKALLGTLKRIMDLLRNEYKHEIMELLSTSKDTANKRDLAALWTSARLGAMVCESTRVFIEKIDANDNEQFIHVALGHLEPPLFPKQAEELVIALESKRGDKAQEEGEEKAGASSEEGEEEDRHDFYSMPEDLSLMTLVLCKSAFVLKHLAQNPPPVGRAARFTGALTRMLKPLRYYQKRAENSVVREAILASRPVLAIALATLWVVIPYLADGLNSNLAYQYLVAELPMTTGFVWSDTGGPGLKRSFERCAGSILGSLFVAFYFLYIPGFPYSTIPYLALTLPLLLLSGRVGHGDHSYAGLSSVVTFSIVFYLIVMLGKMQGDINSPTVREFGVELAMYRVIVTLLGCAIAILVGAFYFPLSCSKDFYAAVKQGLDITQRNSLAAVDRMMHISTIDEEEEEEKEKQELDNLNVAIRAIKAKGTLAVAELTWQRAEFPQELPELILESFGHFYIGSIHLRISRLELKRLGLRLGEKENSRVIETGLESIRTACELIDLLSHACEKTCSGYFSQNRVSSSFEDVDLLISKLIAISKSRQATYQHEKQEKQHLSSAQRACVGRFIRATDRFLRGAHCMSRALNEFTLPEASQVE